LPDEVVERGAEVVDEVAEDDAESQRWLPEHLDPEKVLTGLRIELTDELIRVDFEKLPKWRRPARSDGVVLVQPWREGCRARHRGK
jgi:hypothetical protein